MPGCGPPAQFDAETLSAVRTRAASPLHTMAHTHTPHSHDLIMKSTRRGRGGLQLTMMLTAMMRRKSHNPCHNFAPPCSQRTDCRGDILLTQFQTY